MRLREIGSSDSKDSLSKYPWDEILMVCGGFGEDQSPALRAAIERQLGHKKALDLRSEDLSLKHPHHH